MASCVGAAPLELLAPVGPVLLEALAPVGPALLELLAAIGLDWVLAFFPGLCSVSALSPGRFFGVVGSSAGVGAAAEAWLAGEAFAAALDLARLQLPALSP